MRNLQKPSDIRVGDAHPTRLQSSLPLAIPFDRLGQPLFEGRLRGKAEVLAGAGDIEPASRLAVGLGRVEDQPAGEAAVLGDDAREIANRNLPPGADVDRGVAV